MMAESFNVVITVFKKMSLISVYRSPATEASQGIADRQQKIVFKHFVRV
jgi:hypothetical protein